MGKCKTSGESVKCPHCNEEIDMGVFSRGQEPRSPSEVRAAQLEAEKDDLKKLGRNAVTMDDLTARAAGIRRTRVL